MPLSCVTKIKTRRNRYIQYLRIGYLAHYIIIYCRNVDCRDAVIMNKHIPI